MDAVIAQGYDGGGHTGRVGGLALVDAIKPAGDVVLEIVEEATKALERITDA